MPRLVPSTPTFGTPSRELAPYGGGSSPDTSTSVRLCCSSPNGRAVHSLALRDSAAYIETHSLPLLGTVEMENNDVYDGAIPAVVRTSLPERVRTALERYPAMELLCVDVDPPAASVTKTGDLQKLPLLCLYTKKDVFVLELAYTPSGASEVEGVVLSVKEPFDEVLLGTSTSTSIIRIRQAPQRHLGYATMCPPECMAMLTHDSMTNEYSLILDHSNNMVGTPHVCGMEQIEDQVERITDFCFCQSNSFSLLSSLSIALLKGSGDVLFASPILFRGTVVPRGTVAKSLEYLDAKLKRANPSSPEWRQIRTAKQYILDAFPDDGCSHFLTAQVLSAAFEWPVQMQGPVIIAPESDDFGTLATAIEPVVAGDLVGLAIGHLGNIVEFGILSPTTLIPRFKLESENDTPLLDEELRYGAVVNRVDLRDEENDQQPTNMSVALIRDPIMDTVVHYVTPTCIKSISTNTVKITASKVREQAGNGNMFSPPSKRKDVRPRTTAWSCLDVACFQGERLNVAGAIVSSDAHLGHVMITRLTNGDMAAVNLTETRQLQEMEALADNQLMDTPSQGSGAAEQELRALQDTSPLFEIIDPLMKKVISGLSGMGKIVGSATPTSAVTPELLAAAVTVKERCDREIFLPVVEMYEQVRAKRKELAVRYENQVAQLKALKENISKLNERSNAIHEKAEVVGINAKSLAQRSASVLQSSNDLLPTITQAEFDYFQELKRLDLKTRQWEQEFERLDMKVSTVCDSIEGGGISLQLDPALVGNSHSLLKASETMIKKQKVRLREAEFCVDELADAAGIYRHSDGEAGALQ